MRHPIDYRGIGLALLSAALIAAWLALPGCARTIRVECVCPKPISDPSVVTVETTPWSSVGITTLEVTPWQRRMMLPVGTTLENRSWVEYPLAVKP